jgi:molybdopterin/thiamine biosynthesis adenylyltransferase
MKPYIDYWRQLDILSPDSTSDHTVTLIGVGGIGSPTALTIAKMGLPYLKLYDDDQVSQHNIPSQLYSPADIGQPKVEALAKYLNTFTGAEIETHNQRYDTDKLSDLVVSAVDSMEARQQIWKAIRYNISVPLYVESRMGAEVVRIYSVNPTDPDMVSWYENMLYDDDQAFQAPCTERAIIYTVMVTAGLIANQIKKFLNNEELRKEIIFDLKNLIFLTA